MNKITFQSFATTNRNAISSIFLKYNEQAFEFDFDSLVVTKTEKIPRTAKPFDLEDLTNIPEKLKWASDCLRSRQPVIFTSEDGTIHFGKPYTGDKIPDEVEQSLFPRVELIQPKPNCDYFEQYEGKKKKK
jgi:hypothetical protein